jgi:deoxyadenosine/deoxycytidine kinase
MYLFHSDPGHGWLQVKRQELKDLGILDKISYYSYQKMGDVYLEEDCDYSLFVERMKELGRPFEIKEINSNYDDSIIRSYEGFTL